MRACAPPSIRTAPHTFIHSAYRSSARSFSQTFKMASTGKTGELNIENTNISTAPGVQLTSEQQTIVGSVLDLFAGRPSLAKLALWTDDALFADPITEAKGRERYSAQWYGLQTAFSEIERKSHTVTSSGNPIQLDMLTRYKIKGIGKETTISSKINIFTEGGKITKVEDKWDGNLPDSSIANAFRHLNAASVPHMVSVPKNAEEDAKRGN